MFRDVVTNGMTWKAMLVGASAFLALVMPACSSDSTTSSGAPQPPTPACQFDQPFPYPDGSTYTGMHGNRENNERIFCSGPTSVRQGWSALENHLIFQPLSVGVDGKTLYAIAGKTVDCKLLAVNTEDGSSWCMQDEDSQLTLGVTAGAPEVDEAGYVYVADGWGDPANGGVPPGIVSYYPAGGMRWRSQPILDPAAPLPSAYAAPLGVHFTPGGYIVAASVEGVVFLLDREDGTILASLSLPATSGFSSPDAAPVNLEELPAGLEAKLEAAIGPMTPEALVYVLAGGTGNSGAFTDNSTGVSTRTNQIFVIGGRLKNGEQLDGKEPGGVFAVDVVEGAGGPALALRWVMYVAGGSGTSPTIDPTDLRVVVGDEASKLRTARIDWCNDNTDDDPRPEICAPEWTYQFEGTPLNGHASIDENGVVYAWNQGTDNSLPDIFAVKADPGTRGQAQVVWKTGFGTPLPIEHLWSSMVTVLDNLVIGTVTNIQRSLNLPILPMPLMLEGDHEAVALDRSTGEVVWRVPVEDDSINAAVLGPDGAIYYPLMGMLDLSSPNPDIQFHGGIIQYVPSP